MVWWRLPLSCASPASKQKGHCGLFCHAFLTSADLLLCSHALQRLPKCATSLAKTPACHHDAPQQCHLRTMQSYTMLVMSALHGLPNRLAAVGLSAGCDNCPWCCSLCLKLQVHRLGWVQTAKTGPEGLLCTLSHGMVYLVRFRQSSIQLRASALRSLMSPTTPAAAPHVSAGWSEALQ